MIINRGQTQVNNDVAKSNLQKEIEEISKRHLSMYDEIIGTTGLKGGVAI